MEKRWWHIEMKGAGILIGVCLATLITGNWEVFISWSVLVLVLVVTKTIKFF